MRQIVVSLSRHHYISAQFIIHNTVYRTKWKRQTSLGLELLDGESPPPSSTATRNAANPTSPSPAAPHHPLELYYSRLLPLLPLMLPQHHQYSAYLAHLAARARAVTPSPPTTRRPPVRISIPFPSPLSSGRRPSSSTPPPPLPAAPPLRSCSSDYPAYASSSPSASPSSPHPEKYKDC